MKIQEYFDQQFPKTCQVIRTEKFKESLEGEELVVKNYEDLESIFLKDFSQLKTLTIENCENLTNLELELEQEIEINLVGEFPLLKKYQIKTKKKEPVYIQKHIKGMCRKCRIAWSCLGVLALFFLGFSIYFYKRLNKMDKKTKNSD